MCVCIYFALILFSQTATHITGVNLTDWILAREKFWVILHCWDFYNFATTINTLFNRTAMCDKFITSTCLLSWHFIWCHCYTMITVILTLCSTGITRPWYKSWVNPKQVQVTFISVTGTRNLFSCNAWLACGSRTCHIGGTLLTMPLGYFLLPS